MRIHPLVGGTMIPAIALLVQGCRKAALTGSEEAVRQLVTQIVREHYREKLPTLCYASIVQRPLYTDGLTRALLEEGQSFDPSAKEALALLNRLSAGELMVTLENTRIDHIQRDIRKTTCSADARTIMKVSHITCTGQPSDQGKELDTGAVVRAVDGTMPLSITMGGEIKRLRQWASNRARRASAKTNVGTDARVAA